MVIVTGANGLVGSAIVKKLLTEKVSVIALKRPTSNTRLLEYLKDTITWRDCDITDSISLNESFKGASIVIHCAAFVSFDPQKKDLLFQINVEGTKNVINACLSNGIKKLIHISSIAALGRQKSDGTIDETNKWIESPLNSAYAKSKYLAELEVYRGIEEGLPASIINPSFILSPSDWEKSSAQIFKYIWNERKFYSQGQLNYVDVQDVADIAFKLCERDFIGERFIVNAGNITFKQLFEQIATRLAKKSPYIKINDRLIYTFAFLEEIRSRLLGIPPLITRESIKSTRVNFNYSNQKSISLLNSNYTPLQETLDRCCEYYLRTYSTNK